MTALDTYSTRAAAAPRKRRGSLIAILAMLAIAIVLVADALWIEPYRIEVTHFDIQGNVTSPIKIAHLTDLHTNGLGRRERRVLSILDQEKPDIILITGDSLSAWDPSYAEVQEVYEKLHAPLGVWFVRGNFENWKMVPHERAFYASSGVHLLLNAGALVRPDLWLAGVDDSFTGKPNPDAALAGAPPDAFKILMFHAPAYFDEVAGRVNLCLAGHTHGGQVRVPFMAPIWMPKGCWPYVSGWYESGNTKMYVSRGVGMSMLPIRFDCRPEVAILTILPETK
jgi:predicted MPP superfamily phosphohydrolase